MGILTTCAVCGAEVATKACGRCKTLYCSQHCQAEHWASGHKKQCKKIQRAGGAEQFYADAKFKEAADAAVASCTAEGVPQDAECFICRSSIAGKGIVRGCACRGTMGLAHVACLVRQAEMEMKRMEEWNDGGGIRKWQKCFDCGQEFHGAVKLALGWAAWKTYFSPSGNSADGSRRRRGYNRDILRGRYLGRPETNTYRAVAMEILGQSLAEPQPEDAFAVFEAYLALLRRYWSRRDELILAAQTNIVLVLFKIGRLDEALVLSREIYARRVVTLGASDERTLISGCNLSGSLNELDHFDDAKSLLRDQLLPAARQTLGADHDLTLGIHHNLAAALHGNPKCTRGDLRLKPQSSKRPIFNSTQATTCSKPRPS